MMYTCDNDCGGMNTSLLTNVTKEEYTECFSDSCTDLVIDCMTEDEVCSQHLSMYDECRAYSTYASCV